MGNYYDISNLLSKKAVYNLLLGQRSNGKSYQVKKTVIEHAFETGRKFVYLRRWQADITAKSVDSYFGDMDIKKLTKNKYTHISCYAGSIYFSVLEDGKIKRVQEIGRYLDLNDQLRYKSQTFPDYDYIVFEEFISTGLYLTDEERELSSLISTISRNRQIQVFMIGNTISRVCPYFSAFSLDSSILKMKPGELQVYHYHQEDGEVIDVAVEYCANANFSNKMWFAQSQKQVTGAEWDTYDYPRIPQGEHENVYSIILEYGKFKYMLQLMVNVDNGGSFVHIYPCTTDRLTERVISDRFNISPMYSIDFNVDCKPVTRIKDLIDKKKVCFSDNLTGTDFYTVLGQMGCA